MGPVAQLVFKTGAVVQPTARSVRLRRRSVSTMSPLPQEGEKLLALDPSQFVAERDRLARKLRAEDRGDEAAAVAGLRKPTPVVYAVNRAARDRPKAAREAADAARQVKKTQVGEKQEAFKRAVAELDAALDMLAEVAVAHVAPRGKTASDAMRRRVRDLLRRAVADEGAREALIRGALVEELETVGFSSYAGMAPAPRVARTKGARTSEPDQREERRRARREALEGEVAEAEERLQKALAVTRDAERQQNAAERALASLRAKLDRIGS